ncbi:MAG TPA: nucleoside deaminase [Micromonosporaceae bacterium]|nr:nucleoside deaminase [Micromonosporaceae bacterium]
MTPDDMVAAAIDVADTGMAAGELPIGAVVVMGDDIVAQSHTRERGIGRRLVHADLLAMIAADERLGFAKRPAPLALAVNLEPCVMCLGAAMTLGVAEVFYALESPGDGGTGIAAQWRNSPDTPFFRTPTMTGGIRRAQARDQFRRYCAAAPDSGFKTWARTLADLPDR